MKRHHGERPPVSRLRQSFHLSLYRDDPARPPPHPFRYDESEFVLLDCVDIEAELDQTTWRAPNGTRVGSAAFKDAQSGGALPFYLTELGSKVPTLQLVTYDDLPARIERLKAIGVRPSQSELALDTLNHLLAEYRRANGLATRVLMFPDPSPES
jgi:hypothetical protein